MATSNAHLWAQPIVFDDNTGAPAFSHKVSAVFDNYDGAEDSSRHHNPIGHGPTRYEALLDLLEHLDEPA